MPRDPFDRGFQALTAMAATFVVVLAVSIFVVLVLESLPAIRKFGIGFVTSSSWNPAAHEFGGAAVILGTAITTTVALFIAIPVAVGIATFVTEVAPSWMRGLVGGAVELLAAIPSIIYGMWGLFALAPIMAKTVGPALQGTLGGLPVFSTLLAGTPRGIDFLTASIVLSIMILPFIASVARDSFNLTPAVVKESAYALGATRWEVIRHVILPHSRSGLFGGIILALGRALGETMAVAFVLGNRHAIPTSLFDAGATITVALANEFAEADNDLYYSSLFYLALLLFLMSFGALAAARTLIGKAEKGHR